MSQRKNLFLFTIGPVQSFIAQARKTHDLYAGSSLLSKLIKEAIDKVGGQNVIFPHVPMDADKWEAVESLPNRFIAWIPEDVTDLQAFGKKIECAVRAKWSGIAMDSLTDKKTLQLTIPPLGFFPQINNHLDIFWVIEPDVKNYSTAFKAIEKNLGAVKNVRPFCQFNYINPLIEGEVGRKCSLDGQRNALFYRLSEQEVKEGVQAKKLFSKDNIVFNYYDRLPLSILQPSEGLSAVSFVKRCYSKEKGKKEFESTADIALLDWINYLKNDERYKQYQNNFSEFNAQLLFDENLNDTYLKKQGIELKNRKTVETLNYDLNVLKEVARNAGFKQSKYYAVIAFDGDNMGKWLGGDLKLVNPTTDLELFHTTFAEQLHKFSIEAKNYLNDETIGRGKAVYAGGDDFLGFINLNSLFDVLKKFRELFKEIVSDKLNVYRQLDKEISFSAGICIAHYKEPLSIVLKRAKDMEETAKDSSDDKNAFGISVLTGSGQESEMTLSFGDDFSVVKKLEDLTFALRDGKTSDTFIHNFQRLFEPFIDEKGKVSVDNDLLKTEFKRSILRGAKTEWKSEIEKDLLPDVWSIYENRNLKNFIAVLNTCNFIQRHLSNPIQSR